MQVLPTTARSMGISGSLFECSTGLQAGMRYLRAALDRGGDGCAGVSLYQSGIFVRKLRCTAYGRKVMRAASLHHQDE
jgi:soluble lytic murein transglycosylase-like protein